MFARIRNLTWMLLGQVPTLLTLALLGVIAWWGYVWDWKVPPLTELLESSARKKSEEAEKKQESENKEPQNADSSLHEVVLRVLVSGGNNKEPQKADAPLPLLQLPSEEAMEAAGIEPKPVVERQIDEYVTAHGHIDYDQNHYAHLATRASGTAWSVFKREGDEVKKGDVLALIASPELAALKFDLQQTLLTVKTRERYYKRLKDAGPGVGTAWKDVDSAEFALRDTKIALSKNQQSLQNLGLKISVDELASLSDEQVAVRLRTLGIPDSLLQHLSDRTLTNNLLPMYAPFDGMVVKRDVVIGEMVTPANPQFHLADLRQLWICLHVRMEDAGRLKEGQEVVFHLDGPNEDAPPAKIRWISAEVDEKTRTVPVRAEVANPQGRLRPNSFGDARILVGRQKRAIVPNEALQFDGTSHLVFVRGKSATEFQPRRVQLGPRYKDVTVVLNGVEAGQTIAASGSHVLLSAMLKDRIAGED